MLIGEMAIVLWEVSGCPIHLRGVRGSPMILLLALRP